MIDIRSLLNGGLDAFGKTSSERWKLLVQAVIELQKRTFNGGGSSSSSSIGSGGSSNGSDGASHVTEADHAKKADKAAEATHAETADKALDIANNSIFYKRFLRRDEEDTAEQTIGFLKGLWINAKELFGIDKNGNAVFSSINAKSTLRVDGNAVTKSLSSYEGITVGPEEKYGINQEGDVNANNVNAEGDVSAKENVQGNNLIAGNNLSVGGKANINDDISAGHDIDVAGKERIDRIQSHNYSGTALSDTGFIITADNGAGSSMAVFDYLTIRKKMIINALEIKETHFSAGDIAQSLASCEIARTDYLYIDQYGNEELLGYSKIKVPWLLRGMALVLGTENGVVRGLYARYKTVRLRLTDAQLKRCNRIRCYFMAKDGEREIENWFRKDDLIRCQTWNVTKQNRETFTPDFDNHLGNVYWWRKAKDVSWNTGTPRYVAKDSQGNPTESETTNINNAYKNEAGIYRLATNGTYSENVDNAHAPKVIDGNTYHWFDVEYDYEAERVGATGSADANSDLPAAGDKVVQFGNTTDPDRMNIILHEVNGSGNPDAPSFKMFRGVYTFDLSKCWWGGDTCCKARFSPSTGVRMYAPTFEWITEYGVAKQVFSRPEKYWTNIPLERDDYTNTTNINSYPDYSDDIVDNNGHFVSRVNGKPKNWVRKCRYYEQVSHNGSVWLCSRVESWYWRDSNGNKINEQVAGATHERTYTTQEPSAQANDWTEQVEKGDPGSFKSQVFCRTNTRPNAPSNEIKDGYNKFTNPIPPAVNGQPTWTDGAPDGDAKLWMSTAWFYSDGTHSDWTTPRQQTDNETQDIEFCPLSSYTAIPNNSPIGADRTDIGWYDPERDKNKLPTGISWSDMVWRAERKKSNGEYIGVWVYTKVKGENAIRIDLTNENDTMLYSSSKGLVSGNVTSEAKLFDGSTDVSDKATWQVSAVGCTLSSDNSRNIVVTEMTAQNGTVTVTATYTDKSGAQYTRSAILTLKKLVDVDKYDLDISPSSIAYNITKDQPATSTLSIRIWKMTCDNVRALSEPPTGYQVYANGKKLTALSTGVYSFNTDNSEIAEVEVKIAKSTDLTDILDCETIPVTKAEDGKNVVRLDLDNEYDSIQYQGDGKTKVNGSASVVTTVYLFDGITDKSSDVTFVVDTSNTTLKSSSYNLDGRVLTVSSCKLKNDLCGDGYVTLKCTYNGATYRVKFSVACLVNQDKFDLDVNPNALFLNTSLGWTANKTITVKVMRTPAGGGEPTAVKPSDYGLALSASIGTLSSYDSTTGAFTLTVTQGQATSNNDTTVTLYKSGDSAKVFDRETIPFNRAENGTSPYFADIDNEMDSVACDKNGKTLAAYDATIGVGLWYGSGAISIETLTASEITGFTITPNKTAKTIRIQIDKGTVINEVNTINITVAGGNSGNKYLHFVLNGVRQGENGEPAVLYSLVPSVSSVVKKKDGTYSVNNVSCTRQKNVGGTITSDATDGTITYKLDGGAETAYTNNTNIAVSNFTKSIQFIYKVNDKVVDIETIPMVADGIDGNTPTIRIDSNTKHWIINGVDTGIVAEGKEGKGIAMKGVCDVLYNSEISGSQTSLEGTTANYGECYSVKKTGHLYFRDNVTEVEGVPAGWLDVGEFKGAKGDNSYMHIAYATGNPLNVTTGNVNNIGFTTDSNGSEYDWIGFCTDNNENDPGYNWSSLNNTQKVDAVNSYKWNYMKGMDGNGYERVYLLCKDGFTPTINQGTDANHLSPEYYPAVENYQAGKCSTSSWTDDPEDSPSDTWPVLWWAERKFNGSTKRWSDFCTPTEHNRFVSEIAITLMRDNLYTEANWNTYAAIGHSESYIKRTGDDDLTICRVGDRFIVTGKSSDKGLSHTATYKCTAVSESQIVGTCISHVKDGNNGSNAVKMDIDNEHDSILYDGTGTTKMSGNVTTKAYLFDGITDVSDNANFAISNREGVDSSQATISGRNVTVSGLTSDAVVTIRAEYPKSSGIYYYAKFTVKKLLGIDKYDLIVTPNAIGVNTSNTISDQPITVQVKRTPGNGGTPSYVTFTNKTVNDYGLALEVTDSKGNTLAETTGTAATTQRTFNLTGSMAASVDNVTVLLKKGTDSIVQDVETIPVNQVHNGIDGSGSNAVKIDLDNEMDSIPCDSEGVVMSQTVLSTGARIYNGAAPVTSGVTVKSIQQIAGVTAVSSVVDGVVNVSWTIAKDTNLSVDKFTAQIVLTWNEHDYYGTFTANVVKSGEPGVSPTIYQLSPNPRSIAFSRDSNGNLPSSPKTLEVKIKKTLENNTELVTIAASGLTVLYRKDQMPTASNDSQATAFPAAGLSVTTSDNNIYIAAFNGTTLLDREVVPVVKDGSNGTSPYFADIDNEMEMIPTDSTGKVSVARTVSTIMHLYEGATEIDISDATFDSTNVKNGPSATIATFSAEAEASNGKGKKLSWAFIVGQTMADAYDIEISYTYNDTAYKAIFTIAASKNQAIFQLKPSMSSIPFGRDASNNLTPSNQNVGLSIVKIDGSSTTELTNITSSTGVIVRYSTQSMPANKDAGTGWTSGNISVANSASNLYIAMFNASGVLLDRETVPVVKDGAKGNPGGQATESIAYFRAESDRIDPPALQFAASDTSHTTPTNYSEGEDSNWGEQNKYLYRADKFIMSDGSWYWSAPYFYSEWAEQGPAGNDAYTVKVEPANLIFTQKTIKDNSGSYPLVEGTKTATISVKKGNSNAAVRHTVSIPTNGAVNCQATVSGDTVTVTGIVGNYAEGHVDINVAIGNGPTFVLRLNVYYNLLGTWKQTVEDGIETSISSKTIFTDEKGVVRTLNNIGTYIRGWAENTSILYAQKDGKNLIKNLTSGWVSYEGDTDTISYGNSFEIKDTNSDLYSPVITLEPNTDYCFSAYFDKTPQNDSAYALAPATGNYPNGSDLYDSSESNTYTPTWHKEGDRYYFTFKTGSAAVKFVFNLFFGSDCLLYSPQLERGTTPTEFDVRSIEFSSKIKQTADEIDLGIRNGLNNTGINISTGKVAVEADNFIVSKNGTQVLGVDASTGMTTMQNVNIKGSLMYHKLAVAHSHSNYYTESMNLFSVVGTLPSGKQNLALDFDTVLLTDAPKKSSMEKFTFVFPPASYFPGASVKIINGTYTGGVGAFVSSLSRIELIVAFDQQTEEEKEDAYNNTLNAFAVATPMRCINDSNQHFSAMGYFNSLKFDSHDEVELISTKNYFSQTDHYVWMVVAARGGISDSMNISQSDTLVFEGGQLKDVM